MASISAEYVSKSPTIIECAICLDPIKEGEITNKVNNQACKHLFHKDCFTPWEEHCQQYNQRVSCPLCIRVDPNSPVPNQVLLQGRGWVIMAGPRPQRNPPASKVAYAVVLGTSVVEGIIVSIGLKYLVSTPASIAAGALFSGLAAASFGCFLEGRPGIGLTEGIQTEGGRQIGIRAAIGSTILRVIAKTTIGV